jgi:hypothetical protein
MKNKLELTPEWVFEKMSDTTYADGEGNINLCTGCIIKADFIELALETLNISHESYDFTDECDELVFGFEFRIEDIQEECPSLYKRMREMDINNSIHKNLFKN